MRRLSQKGRAVHWAALRHVELCCGLKEKGDAVLRTYRSLLNCRWDACCMPQAVHQAACPRTRPLPVGEAIVIFRAGAERNTVPVRDRDAPARCEVLPRVQQSQLVLRRLAPTQTAAWVSPAVRPAQLSRSNQR